MRYEKQPPKIITYRDYKRFSNYRFQHELDIAFHYHDLENIELEAFGQIYMGILNRHIPLKFKFK